MWGVTDAPGEQTGRKTQVSVAAEPSAAMFCYCGPECQDLKNIMTVSYKHRHC